MKYEESFEKEFISRTLKLLRQYETSCGITKYEDTLFLNLCVGLLIIPQQAYYDQFQSLQHTFVDKKEWSIDIRMISVGEKDVYNIIRHIRNSISHKRFELISENSYDITHIKINDKVHRDDKEYSFAAKFPIADFKNFVINITEYALKNFANQ
jgi:hypothetical protein